MIPLAQGPISQKMCLDQTPPPLPFYKKDWKCPRVTAASVQDWCCGFFHLLRTLQCCNKKAHKREFSVSDLFFYRSCNRLLAWCCGPRRLIDFSRNTGLFIKEETPHANEVEELKKIYGNEPIEQWLQIENEDVFLSEISRLRMGDGCCLGNSLDFLSHYLRAVNRGASPLESVEQLSGRYAHEPPKEAQIIQIFHRALRLKRSFQPTLAQIQEDFIREISKDANSPSQKKKQLNEARIHRANQETRVEVEKLMFLFRPLLKRLGLEFQADRKIHVYVHMYSLRWWSSWEPFIKQLLFGTYLVVDVFVALNENSHAFPFIKLEGTKNIVMEPNWGIYEMEAKDVALKLLLFAGVTPENPTRAFIFFPIALAPSN